MQSHFQLASPAFTNGDTIPDRYTCKGEGASPPLIMSSVPDGSVTLALIVHDLDAPSGDFVHWIVWNMPANLDAIGENSLPDTASQGVNGFGDTQYGALCPPSGSHRYAFDMYALDSDLALPAGSGREELVLSMQGHVLGQASLSGVVNAPNYSF